jgi:hypothetical protein
LLRIASLLKPPPLQQAGELSPFDALVGKLMFEALVASATGRLSEQQREYIAAQADAAGFLLKDYLEGEWKQVLAEWNQKHSRSPDKLIKTFSQALKSKSKLRRGLLRTLYRAKENYLMAHTDLSAA